MADIRCPICDRPNDANAERCWYCQAVLHPEKNSSDVPSSDWLDGLRDPSSAPPAADDTPQNPQESSQPQSDIPDWLARIRMREQGEQDKVESEPEQSEEQKPQPDTNPDIPDWLSKIIPEQGQEPDYLAVDPPANEKPAKSDLENEQSDTNEPSESKKSEIPDWLSAIIPEQGQEPTNPATVPPSNKKEKSFGKQAESEPDGDEWLKKLESWQPDDSYSSHLPHGESPVEQVSSDSSQPANPEQAPSPDQPGSENPEWLKRLESWQPDDSYSSRLPHGESPTGQIASDSSQPTNPGKTSLPDQPENSDHDEWARQFDSWQPNNDSSRKQPESDSIKLGPNVSPPQSTGSNDDNSDWLQAYRQDETVNPTPLDQSPNSAAFLPDEENLNPTDQSIQTPAQPSSGNDENWLNEFKALSPDENLADQVFPTTTPDNQTKSPFDKNDMQAFFGESPAESADAGDKTAPALEPAALPAWIKALSPKHKTEPAAPRHEALMPADSRGPLAGIEGTLQGEELSQYYTRPQTYSGAIKVSENQQQRTQTLKNIVDQARWVDEGLPEKTSSHSWVIRALVSFAMLIAVLIPLFFKGAPSVPPSLYPDEVVKAFNTINSLPVDKPVLVAADFDGSLYGELNWSLQPMITQLMDRNIPIAYLSTNSVGTSLFSQTLIPLVANFPAYSSTDKLVNLGYLPGGSTGLQNLASDPLTALPLAANLQPAWKNPPLVSIKQISDFGALIVITENADTARYWIEQVKPSLGTTPMLVVISAQSAPLLQPYYDSGQISGYLSGLNSATAYEALNKNPQYASSHLSSFQLTMILAALLVLVGGIVSLVMYRPGKERKQGAPR